MRARGYKMCKLKAPLLHRGRDSQRASARTTLGEISTGAGTLTRLAALGTLSRGAGEGHLA